MIHLGGDIDCKFSPLPADLRQPSWWLDWTRSPGGRTICPVSRSCLLYFTSLCSNHRFTHRCCSITELMPWLQSNWLRVMANLQMIPDSVCLLLLWTLLLQCYVVRVFCCSCLCGARMVWLQIFNPFSSVFSSPFSSFSERSQRYFSWCCQWLL